MALHSVYGARGLSGDALDVTPVRRTPPARSARASGGELSDEDLSLSDAQRLVGAVIAGRIDGGATQSTGWRCPK